MQSVLVIGGALSLGFNLALYLLETHLKYQTDNQSGQAHLCGQSGKPDSPTAQSWLPLTC